MAGTTWPTLTPGRKAKASEVESKFDWLEGSLAPMNSGASTDAVFDIGTTTANWRNAYFSGFIRVGDGSNSAPSIEITGNPTYGIRTAVTAGVLQVGFIRSSTIGAQISIAASTTLLEIGNSNERQGSIFMYAGGSTNFASIVCQHSTSSLQLFGSDSQGSYLLLGGNLLLPNVPTGTTGTLSLGNATWYYNDISYKTLTDRGCLAWMDEGVECQEGTIATDLQAIQKIKKHLTKKTVYGLPMLDYKTFPKVSYRPAGYSKEGKFIEHLRDENGEPFWVEKTGQRRKSADGIEMTSVFSLMLGAIKELSAKVAALESKA